MSVTTEASGGLAAGCTPLTWAARRSTWAGRGLTRQTGTR